MRGMTYFCFLKDLNIYNMLFKHTETLTGLIMASCLFVQYLDSGVKRRSILLLEAGSDVQHVHLAPRHHDPHQGAVVSSSTLTTAKKKNRGGVELLN